ncbi:hypothetical protein AAHA92_12274 [Salvia divinorum]|uniref:Uncharacterized protein n=1 Tax=Salvia divinorum TaxID=28513 RepID=A0ABD1HJQ8_SALDI
MWNSKTGLGNGIRILLDRFCCISTIAPWLTWAHHLRLHAHMSMLKWKVLHVLMLLGMSQLNWLVKQWNQKLHM